MKAEDSEINIKRREWALQIRKKEVNDYMKKRRYEMLAQNCLFGRDVEESQKIELLAKLVSQFNFDKAVGFFKELVEMDAALSVFYDITGLNPASPPAILRQMLERSSDLQLQSRSIIPKSWKDRVWTSEQLQKLRVLFDCMIQWWQKEQDLIKNMVGLIHRIDNYDHMVNYHVMECLSFIASLLLLFETVGELLREKAGLALEYELTSVEKQRGMCVSILHNFLAADDELLLPILEQFLDLNGLNSKMITLYYNIFIIKGVSPRLRVKMMQYFTAVLESDCQLFLEDHKELIYILHICAKSSPQFTGDELAKFLTISQKLLRLLNNLMKVLNLRYQNCGLYLQSQTSNNDDHDFVLFLASILDFLSSQQAGIRSLAQQEHLSKFLISHIQMTTHQQSLKTTRILLGIVNRITYDHCAFHYFMSSTPRLLQQIVAIVSRVSENGNYSSNDELQIRVVESMLLVCSNLCTLEEVAEMFLNLNLMNVAANIFYKHQTNKGRNLRLECQYLFLNLLLHLKQTFPKREDPTASFDPIFSSPSNLNMFYDLFKFIPDTRKIVNFSLIFLAFLLNIDSNQQLTARLGQLMKDSTLQARLRELEQCGDEQIEERVYEVRIVGRERSGGKKQDWQYE